MKKLLILFLILSILPVTAFAEQYYYDGSWSEHTEKIKLYVDSTKIYCDVPPVIVAGRTLVPARAFFEKLGCKVGWDEKKRVVSVSNNKYNIKLTIDSKVALINSKEVSMDVPAKIITDKSGTGRTMIPVRFVSEFLGFDVDWDADSYTVNINGKKEMSAIKYINTKASKTYDTISVGTDGKIEPKVLQLSNPSRLVLDFYGYEFDFGKKAFSTGVCYSELRYAQHEEYARVVLDMTCEYTYSITSAKSECSVTISKTGELTDKEDKKSNATVTSVTVEPPKKGNGLVVIDPGHGGSDPGAIGYDDDGEINITEAEVNLDISLRLYKILKNEGINVAITRTKDEWVDLYDRAPFANELDASLFVSVHNNSSVSESANGSSVYYYTGSTDEAMKEEYGITSKEAAQIILDEMLDECGLYDRKIADGSKLVVLKHTKMPGVLVEGAFISNPDEQELLATPSFRQKMAQGIANGVIKVLKKMGIKK